MEKQLVMDREGHLLKGLSTDKGSGGFQDLPLEVVVLLSVFARIEARLQEKRRALHKEVEYATS
ncbi:MAG: hypothetical protein ACRDHW_22875 [Ktedonobacteraceae bacterium]